MDLDLPVAGFERLVDFAVVQEVAPQSPSHGLSVRKEKQMNGCARPEMKSESARQRRSRRWTVILALCAMATVWYAAICVDSATRLAVTNVYAQFLDMPYHTLYLIYAVRNNLVWAYALAVTLLLIVLLFRARKHLLLSIALLMALTAACVSLATFQLLLPYSKCYEYWPDWPDVAATRPHIPGVVGDPASDKLATGPGTKIGKCGAV